MPPQGLELLTSQILLLKILNLIQYNDFSLLIPQTGKNMTVQTPKVVYVENVKGQITPWSQFIG